MANYNLNALNTIDFEHMVQALALKSFGSSASIYGAGPDGAREVTFQGALKPPLTEESWDGYCVVQAKFKAQPSSDHAANFEWLKKELAGEFRKFFATKRKLRRPEYYVFATNIVLTAAQNGTYDKFCEEFQKVADKLGIKGFDVWHYEKVCRLLDDSPNIRMTYAGAITSGDILFKLQETLNVLGKGLASVDFGEVMTLFLQNEMRDDLYARLEQAGHLPSQRIALSNVFVDVPAALQPIADAPAQAIPGFIEDVVKDLLIQGGHCLRPSISSLAASRGSQDKSGTTRIFANEAGQFRYDVPLQGEAGRYVLVGGPGQGKSTVGQFICQLYRATILKERPPAQLTGETRQALKEFDVQCALANIVSPEVRRFPIRVVLDRFAAEISRGDVTSLLDFIRRRIERVTERTIILDDLRIWLKESPWLLVLDGLDEVPASSNREQVMGAIHQFCGELAVGDADVLIVATTRPQGYNADFGPEIYQHRYLVPLSVEQAMHYAERLVTARYATEPDRQKKILGRLRQASQSKTTARLMRSPLQVTILAALVDVIGQPPQERWKLFSDYFNIVYRREIERDIALSRVLSDNRDEVEVLHRRAALLLQARSEEVGGTESSLSRGNLRELISNIFEEEDFPPAQAESKTQDIFAAALDRLVFLVPLQDDAIGFEVRSLQEFMAAEALMEGSDEQIRRRLEVIAPAPHWRNVFLFAAGKCFSTDRRHLCTEIVTLCSQMNTMLPQNDEDAIATASLLGSRLALDLLGDDVARNSTRLKRQLLDIALELMRLGDVEACSRLATLYEDDVETLFRDKCGLFLSQSTLNLQWGAWIVVRSLAAQDVNWATELAITRWPDDPEEALKVIAATQSPIPAAWIEPLIIPLLPRLHPSDIEVLHGHRRQTLKTLKRQGIALPGWANAMWDISMEYSGKDKSRIKTCLIKRDDEEARISSDFTIFEVTLGSLNQSVFVSPEYQALEKIPPGVSDWAVYRVAPSFARRPGRESLATSLRAIADDWEREDGHLSLEERQKRSRIGFLVPWPLRSCVMICLNAKQLRSEALRVEQGNRGDEPDWRAAEVRWNEQGITQNDWMAMNDANWPYGSQIGTSGYPFEAAGYVMSHDSRTLLLSSLHDNFLAAPGNQSRRIWAQICVAALWTFDEQDDNEIPAKMRSVKLWRQLLEKVVSINMQTSWLPAIIGDDLTVEEIEFLNWLGCHSRSFSYSDSTWSLTSQLADAYCVQPKLLGLLPILGILALGDLTFEPPRLLSSANIDLGSPERISARTQLEIDQALLIFDICHLKHKACDDTDLDLIARRVIELDLQDEETEVINMFLVFGRQRIEQWKRAHRALTSERFFLSVWKAARNKGNGQELSMVPALNQLAAARRSHLISEKLWNSLSLPHLPANPNSVH